MDKETRTLYEKALKKMIFSDRILNKEITLGEVQDKFRNQMELIKLKNQFKQIAVDKLIAENLTAEQLEREEIQNYKVSDNFNDFLNLKWMVKKSNIISKSKRLKASKVETMFDNN